MPHPLIDSITAHAQMFVKLRRELQLSAERDLVDWRTEDLVAGRLEQWGYKLERGVGGSGIVAQLRRGKGTKRLGLRAEMGAAPAVAGSAFGHTAMLLAAAHYLARQGDFSGTLNLVFQCADLQQGGARRMVADGLFDRFPCDAIFAMHGVAGQPQGQLLLRDGPAMASHDEVFITLHGDPLQGAADPVVAGAAIVMGLQSLVARHTDAQRVAVQVSGFEARAVPGAAAPLATLQLGVRALAPEVRDNLQRRITALTELQALSYGVQPTVDYRRHAPVLFNSALETEFARQLAMELLGPGQVQPQAPAFAGCDDFAFMLEQVPGSYLLLGNGDGPAQDFNEANLPIGAAYWAMLAQCYLH
ncbi:hydrolase [Pseudorhodoferax aquiterrae]|uniref:Hydrolase n=1 Tax=Pseudorhodoferax aquiterrae TaxID=747304 RepID=A0ABQ3G9I0_9BURK|nr:M20/M25/M40 family metallo-hydrolase [Pseudorhodoferax aquiterrae]GHC96645.1 hydrolase [Pseudorhodoferax aquiterrae]